MSRAPIASLFASLAFSVSMAPPDLVAQYDRAPAVPAHALQGVTVIQADGRTQAGVTLIVRGGLIVGLGPGLEIPADAMVLAGDSLRVYPGLVDADGSVPLAFPQPDSAQGTPAWSPSRRASGFLPHRLASHHLDAVGADLKDLRQQGIVASATHPDGGLAPGQVAALLHRADAEVPWDLVANESLGLAMAFQGARGAYPSTLFGVVAYLRQAWLDAARDEVVRAAYSLDPAGMTPPRFDPDLGALRASLRGSIPVLFRADGQENIRRVLRLSDEFGFRPVIVGGEQAGALANTLAERGVPTFLSVDLDPPSAWDPEDTTGVALKPEAERERRALEERYRDPALLHGAGATFALTSGGGGDLLAGVRRAIEYGLPEAAALRAVTSTPASLLGLPHVTRVAEGMAATFIVTTGELFGAETRVAYTFVEGALETGAAPEGKEPPAADLTVERASRSRSSTRLCPNPSRSRGPCRAMDHASPGARTVPSEN